MYEDRSHDVVAEHQLRRVLAGTRLADVFAEARLRRGDGEICVSDRQSLSVFHHLALADQERAWFLLIPERRLARPCH